MTLESLRGQSAISVFFHESLSYNWAFFFLLLLYTRLTESTLKNSVSIVEFERGVEGVLALYKTLAANVATEKGRVDIENQVRNDTHVQYEEVRKKKKNNFSKLKSIIVSL